MARAASEESRRSARIDRMPILSATVATILTFLIALASLIVLHETARAVLKERLDEQLIGVARLAALGIRADEHARLVRAEQTNGPEYAPLAERLRAIVATMPDLTYVWTVRSTPEGLRFVLDAALPIDADDDRVSDQSAVGDPVDQPDPALLKAFATEEPTVGSRPYTDRWGTFLGAYAPIRHADGRLEAILGVDVEVGAYARHLARMRRTLWGSILVAFSLSVAVGVGTFVVQRARGRADAAEERARRALRLAQARLHAAVRSARIGLWEWQPDTDSIWWSEESAALVGGLEDAPSRAGSAWHAILHSEDAERLERALADHLAGRTPEVRVECRTRDPVGGGRWLEVFGRVAERDRQDRPIRVSGALLDIGARRTAERRIAASQRRTALILETAAAGVMVYDTTGRLLECNRESERILGLSRAELSKIGLADGDWHVIYPSGRPFARDELPAVVTLRTGRSCRGIEMGFRRLDGSQRWLLVNAEPLRRAGSDASDIEGVEGVEGVVLSFSDITAEHEARQALESSRDAAEAANRAKSEFLASMSHEIRTPMTAILGFARLLEEDPTTIEDETLRGDAIATIRRNGEHLLTIINDILDFSKIEAGRMTVELVPVDPREIVEDVVALLRAEGERRGLELRVEAEAPVPASIETDPIRLRQILTNLVGNAIRFTQRGSVVVSLRDACLAGRPALAFDVRDTGIGIEAAALARLFRPFTQADASTSRRYGGTGLGLAISLRLARLLGGEIDAASEPGAGSVFTLRVPTERIEGAQSAAPRSEPVPRHAQRASRRDLDGLRILVVDDGADNRALIERILRGAGATTRAVSGGREALDAVRSSASSVDVVILDLDMPDIDGFGVARSLAAEGSLTPLIAVTAHASDADRAAVRSAGFVDHVGKPIDPERLVDACATWGRAAVGPPSPEHAEPEREASRSPLPGEFT